MSEMVLRRTQGVWMFEDGEEEIVSFRYLYVWKDSDNSCDLARSEKFWIALLALLIVGRPRI
jgi:hypothetical protein